MPASFGRVEVIATSTARVPRSATISGADSWRSTTRSPGAWAWNPRRIWGTRLVAIELTNASLTMPDGTRSKTRVPGSSSSLARALDSVGWLAPSALAASVT